MNLQSILLIGTLLSNVIATDFNYYEISYTEEVKRKEDMYLEQVKENPGDIEALTELGNHYMKLWEVDSYSLENFYKAEEVYKEIVEINPKSTMLAEFYLNSAFIVSSYDFGENDKKLEFYEKSEEEYLRILEIDNDNIEIMINLGELYAKVYSYADDVEFFDKAERTYFDVLNIEQNNIEARYKLIDLYEIEWRIDNSSYKDEVDHEMYFEKIEQQYLDILYLDEEYNRARFDLIRLYELAYNLYDIDCVDKMEEQSLEMLKRDPDGKQYTSVVFMIGGVYGNKWENSDYTDDEAFEKAEYCYKYILDIYPDDSWAQYRLANLYSADYYIARNMTYDDFKKFEQVYKQYSSNLEADHDENVACTLGALYEDRWSEDKSDYTYYYMAENEYYDAIDRAWQLKLKDAYRQTQPIDIFIYLTELYEDRYEFDHDKEVLESEKNRLVEKISSTYADEISYIDSENQDSYVNKEKLKDLGTLYYYVWQLDTDDMQYYEKAENALLKSQEIENDYKVLLQLGELYTERWVLDKSKIEYKRNAIQCFDEIVADEDEYPQIFWLKGDIYLLLEKLEL